jgi:outer membrane biosynthesis protein TonB
MDGEQIVHDVAETVRALVSEAERRATEIVRDAEAEAARIRSEAEAESKQRLSAARNAFEELQSKLGIGAEVEPGPVTAPEPTPPSVPEPTPPPPDPAPSPEPAPEPEPPLIPEPAPPPDEGTPPQISTANGSGPPASAKSDDAAGARLVAMNMALDGATREAIAGHLADAYELTDPGEIADEVLKLASK